MNAATKKPTHFNNLLVVECNGKRFPDDELAQAIFKSVLRNLDWDAVTIGLKKNRRNQDGQIISLCVGVLSPDEDQRDAANRMVLCEGIEDMDDCEVTKIGDRAFIVREFSPAEKIARREREEFQWMFGATLPEPEIARPRPGL